MEPKNNLQANLQTIDTDSGFAIIKMFKHAVLSVRRDRGFCFYEKESDCIY